MAAMAIKPIRDHVRREGARIGTATERTGTAQPISPTSDRPKTEQPEHPGAPGETWTRRAAKSIPGIGVSIKDLR
jgi:hypothetical protein